MDNIRTMEFIGVDDWDCPVYKCIENGYLWKDINLGKGIPSLYSSSNNEFDGEPDSPIKDEITVVFKTKYEENPRSFDYQMLDRLRSDITYYLGYGNRNKDQLYYGDEQKHIEEMKKLHNSFPDDEKPEWLTYEDILNYEKLMLAK